MVVSANHLVSLLFPQLFQVTTALSDNPSALAGCGYYTLCERFMLKAIYELQFPVDQMMELKQPVI